MTKITRNLIIGSSATLVAGGAAAGVAIAVAQHNTKKDGVKDNLPTKDPKAQKNAIHLQGSYVQAKEWEKESTSAINKANQELDTTSLQESIYSLVNEQARDVEMNVWRLDVARNKEYQTQRVLEDSLRNNNYEAVRIGIQRVKDELKPYISFSNTANRYEKMKPANKLYNELKFASTISEVKDIEKQIKDLLNLRANINNAEVTGIDNTK